jgi:hypothetical protein
MDKTIELIFTIYGGALTLLTVYGAFKADRKLFLSGICFFSILPIVGESMSYSADKGMVHVMVIMIYVTQFILAFPSNIQYGAENTAAGKLVAKIALGLLATKYRRWRIYSLLTRACTNLVRVYACCYVVGNNLYYNKKGNRKRLGQVASLILTNKAFLVNPEGFVI